MEKRNFVTSVLADNMLAKARMKNGCVLEMSTVMDEIKEKGRLEGRLEGQLLLISELVASGVMTLEDAALKMQMTVEEMEL